MKSTRKQAGRGVALIIVLGMLSVLALLAVTFASLTGLDRATSRSYLDMTRARMVADSGVQHAIAHLREQMALGRLMEEDQWVIGDGRTVNVDGKNVAFSGAPESGTYGVDGDFYEVRIIDSSSRINVNDGVAWGPDHSVSRNLRRILNVLGAQPSVAVAGLGDRILDGRPAAGYATLFDLARTVGHDRETFDRIRPFLTVSSWSDPHVASPVPLSAATAGLYPVEHARPVGAGGPLYRYGHQKNWLGERIRLPLTFGGPIWGRDSLNPQWIEIVSRSPVNVNTAPPEVLTALLVDLEGFHLTERNRTLTKDKVSSPCRSPGGAYGWTSLRYTYDPSGDEGDECGFVTRTVPIIGQGGDRREGLPAELIVGEILACRGRNRSPQIEDLDYAKAPFGGPFRSWAQFNQFADALAQRGLLPSQAVADVLKANFNPNLHLNELNPNENLFTLVDKTDLIVNSTEFCFTPMGTFEIESVGRIVRPEGRTLVARQEVRTVVRLFEPVRETAQRDFAAGSFAPRRRGPETNNNRSVECGPEPDNGPGPLENGWEGYLQLPTYGSNLAGSDAKPAGELWTTLEDPQWYPGAKPTKSGGRQFGSVIHAHFTFDHAAHHHAGRTSFSTPPDWDGFRLPQGGWQTAYGRRCCISRNWADRTEELPSPYSPVDAGRVESHPGFRLARSFPASPRAPAGFETAPGDLRIDGAYVERDSAFGYWIDESVSFNFNEGTIAFWMKPAFSPETTGKRRTLLSIGRYHAAARDFMNPSPFGLFFVPDFGQAPERAPSYPGGAASFPPQSLIFGYGFSSATGYNWEVAKGGAPDDSAPERHATGHAFAFSPSRTPLGAHRWTHVAVTWRNPRNELPREDTAQIYVNGRILPGSRGVTHLFTSGAEKGQPFVKTPRWTTHSLRVDLPGVEGTRWCKNLVRLGGEPSKLFDLPGRAGLFPGNFSADATFDEFYLWLDRATRYQGGLWGAQTIWSRGRYYRPDDARTEDARFTSRAILPPLRAARGLPPSAGSAGGAARPSISHPRLVGIAWTEFAEAYDGGEPVMLDHSTMATRRIRMDGGTVADLSVEIDGIAYGPFRNDRFSPVRSPDGSAPEVEDSGGVRYSAKLKAGLTAGSGAILLSSPVLDDVTLFFAPERPEILEWVIR